MERAADPTPYGPPSAEPAHSWLPSLPNLKPAFAALRELASLITPTANSFNDAKHPTTTCCFICICFGALLLYFTVDKYMHNQRQKWMTEPYVTGLTNRCTDHHHEPSCIRLERMLGLNLPVPKSPPPPPPPPLFSADMCWAPGAAIEAAGLGNQTLLSVQDAINVYAQAKLKLRPDAAAATDLHAFVQAQVDVNRDGRITRYELYAGLSLLVKRSHWRDELPALIYQQMA